MINIKYIVIYNTSIHTYIINMYIYIKIYPSNIPLTHDLSQKTYDLPCNTPSLKFHGFKLSHVRTLHLHRHGLTWDGPSHEALRAEKNHRFMGKSMVYPTFFFGIQPSQVDFHRRSSKKLAMFIDFPELNNQKGVPSPMDVASQAAVHGCLVHLTSGGARRGFNLANWDQCWREERIGNMFENDTYVHIYIYIHIHIHIIYIYMLICDRRRLCQVSDYRRNSFLLNLPQRTLAPACSITKNMLIC